MFLILFFGLLNKPGYSFSMTVAEAQKAFGGLGLELEHCHFLFILLTKASHIIKPKNQRVRKYHSTLQGEELQSHMSTGMILGSRRWGIGTINNVYHILLACSEQNTCNTHKKSHSNNYPNSAAKNSSQKEGY